MQTLTSPYFSTPVVGPAQQAANSRVPLERLRWYITGNVKSGKTSFLASIPGCLIIDCEGKMGHISPQHLKADYVQPTSLSDVEKVIEGLVKNRGKTPYKIVAIDTIDEFLHSLVIPGMTDELIQAALAAKRPAPDITDITEYKSSDRGSGGWNLVYKRIGGILRELNLAGYGWVVTGHTKEVEIKKRVGGSMQNITTRRPAAPPGLVALLYRLAENICTAGWHYGTREEPVERRIGDRVIQDTRTVEERYPCIRVSQKLGDADDSAELGSNITLPPEIHFPQQGEAWSVVSKVYQTAVGTGGQ